MNEGAEWQECPMANCQQLKRCASPNDCAYHVGTQKRDAVLAMVKIILVRAERSPGLSTAPFSIAGWRLIEAALMRSNR